MTSSVLLTSVRSSEALLQERLSLVPRALSPPGNPRLHPHPLLNLCAVGSHFLTQVSRGPGHHFNILIIISK